MKKSLIKNIAIFFLVFLAIASIFSLYNVKDSEVESITMQTFVEEINNDDIKKVEVVGNKLNITKFDDSLQTLDKEPTESLSTLLDNLGIDKQKIQTIPIEIKTESGLGYWLGMILPFLLPLILIVAFLWFMMRQVQGANSKAMSFGQSRAKQSKKDDKIRQPSRM